MPRPVRGRTLPEIVRSPRRSAESPPHSGSGRQALPHAQSAAAIHSVPLPDSWTFSRLTAALGRGYSLPRQGEDNQWSSLAGLFLRAPCLAEPASLRSVLI